jgi:type II secretory ATPase GspE/PulE/Tfp pilus assembly ATPase PilB-like protein
MIRRLLVFLIVVLVFGFGGVGQSWAQEGGWPAAPLQNGWSATTGFYLNWIKLLVCWLVFVAWVGTTDWVSRDAVQIDMDYRRWNPVVVGVFIAAYVLLWILPWFWVGFPLVALAWVVPLTTYILVRNRRVEASERVLTSAHIRFWAATHLGKLGFKVEAEAKDPLEAGVPVTLSPAAGTSDREAAARLLMARQTAGFQQARKVIYDALCRRADAILLDYSQQGVAVRLMIDGLWQNGEPMDREVGDPVLESLKALCGVNAKDRQGRQDGRFVVDYTVFKRSVFEHVERAKEAFRKRLGPQLTREFSGPGVSPVEIQLKVKMACDEKIRERFATPIGAWTPVDVADLAQLKGTEKVNPNACLDKMSCAGSLTSQGTPTGERAVIQLQVKKTRFASLDEIGMRTKMQEQILELIGRPGGFVLLSAIPGGGLRTTTNLILRTADRFVREFAGVEDEANRYEAVENIPITTYKSTEGQTPASVLANVFHMEPQVVVVRDLVNAETVAQLLAEVARPRIIVSTVRARTCVEAIYRVLALGVPAADFAPALNGVLCQRLVRKLCDTCKEGYAPTPQVLAQLGIPAGRVQALYRPPQQREQVCPECGGIGYLGRTAIFEILIMDDNLRQTLATNPNPELFRQAAQKAGMRSVQDEGIVLVAKGVTSLQELMRVLKQ